ncbi:MAG TPA: IS110 family transposase [Acetobacteraceae bacterium]
MEALIERAAGLDVHQGSVVACVILGAPGRRPTKEVRSFGTMRRDLACLRDWLLERGVTHVGMEATGIYWHPVHAALEGAFTLIVGNASHMRNLPGRKTDVKDAEWIADLVRHGLMRASFVPPPEVRVLRDLVRHRKALAGTLAAERNRTLKLLESAGIKLAGVMSSVFGVSGMLMLRALAEGSAAPAAMADLAKRRLRRKIDRLALALDGQLAEHQRLLLGMHIRRLGEIDRDLAEVEAAIGTAMRPFAAQQALLVTIPGVDALTAATIVAEIGANMTAFGTAQRLAAWAGLCPANHERARVSRSGAAPARATHTSRPHWSRRPSPPHRPRAPTCATSSTDCEPAWARRRRPWRSGTRSWSPSSTCCNAAAPLPTSAPITSTVSTSIARPSAWSAASTRSETTSCSAPRWPRLDPP